VERGRRAVPAARRPRAGLIGRRPSTSLTSGPTGLRLAERLGRVRERAGRGGADGLERIPRRTDVGNKHDGDEQGLRVVRSDNQTGNYFGTGLWTLEEQGQRQRLLDRRLCVPRFGDFQLVGAVHARCSHERRLHHLEVVVPVLNEADAAPRDACIRLVLTEPPRSLPKAP